MAGQGFSKTTVKSLRAEAKERYQRGKGDARLKGYSKMSRSELAAKLGKDTATKKENRSIASTKTADAIAQKVVGGQTGDDKTVARVQAKARLLRSVKREIDAARKANPDITQDELRKVAGKAFVKEAQALKQGKPEVKPGKGGQSKAAPVDRRKQAESDYKAAEKDMMAASDKVKQLESELAERKAAGPKATNRTAKSASMAGGSRQVYSKSLTKAQEAKYHDEINKAYGEMADAQVRQKAALKVLQEEPERPQTTKPKPPGFPGVDYDRLKEMRQGVAELNRQDARERADGTYDRKMAAFSEEVKKQATENASKAKSSTPSLEKPEVTRQKQLLGNKIKVALGMGIGQLKKGVDDEGQPLTREAHEAMGRKLKELHSRLKTLGQDGPEPKIPEYKETVQSKVDAARKSSGRLDLGAIKHEPKVGETVIMGDVIGPNAVRRQVVAVGPKGVKVAPVSLTKEQKASGQDYTETVRKGVVLPNHPAIGQEIADMHRDQSPTSKAPKAEIRQMQMYKTPEENPKYKKDLDKLAKRYEKMGKSPEEAKKSAESFMKSYAHTYRVGEASSYEESDYNKALKERKAKAAEVTKKPKVTTMKPAPKDPSVGAKLAARPKATVTSRGISID